MLGIFGLAPAWQTLLPSHPRPNKARIARGPFLGNPLTFLATPFHPAHPFALSTRGPYVRLLLLLQRLLSCRKWSWHLLDALRGIPLAFGLRSPLQPALLRRIQVSPSSAMRTLVQIVSPIKRMIGPRAYHRPRFQFWLFLPNHFFQYSYLGFASLQREVRSDVFHHPSAEYYS